MSVYQEPARASQRSASTWHQAEGAELRAPRGSIINRCPYPSLGRPSSLTSALHTHILNPPGLRCVHNGSIPGCGVMGTAPAARVPASCVAIFDTRRSGRPLSLCVCVSPGDTPKVDGHTDTTKHAAKPSGRASRCY